MVQLFIGKAKEPKAYSHNILTNRDAISSKNLFKSLICLGNEMVIEIIILFSVLVEKGIHSNCSVSLLNLFLIIPVPHPAY